MQFINITNFNGLITLFLFHKRFSNSIKKESLNIHKDGSTQQNIHKGGSTQRNIHKDGSTQRNFRWFGDCFYVRNQRKKQTGLRD